MWTPKEVRKLIAQCAGIVFGVGGILMMIADVKATGKINISTNLVSGQIESGSAGLLLLFFAFFLVLIPSFYGGHQVSQQKKNQKNNSKTYTLSLAQKDAIVAIISGGLTTMFFLCSHFLAKGYPRFSNLLIIAGYCFGTFTGFATVAAFIDFADEKKEQIES